MESFQPETISTSLNNKNRSTERSQRLENIKPTIIKYTMSSNIMRTFIVIFISVALFNSIIFGISDYRDSKKQILRDFKYLAFSINNQLAEAIWKSNRYGIETSVDTLLASYDVSAIRIINSDTNYVEVEKVKSGRDREINYLGDIIYSYDKKNVRVGKIEIYSDSDAMFGRSKKTIALILFKTFIETLTIFVLIFWAFKKLFFDYLAEAESIIQNKEYVPIDLKYSHPLSLLERTFRDLLNNLIQLYLKNSEDKKENAESEQDKEQQKTEKVPDAKIVPITASRILQFLNPNRDSIKKFVKDIYMFSRGVREDISDTYMFIELDKNKDLLFMLVDYGSPVGMTSSDIGIILKDAERDILIKQAGNNKNISLSKILEFLDKKIRNRFGELNMNPINGIDFRGIAFHYDKVANKFEYASKGVTIIKFGNNKLSTYDDFGSFADRSPHAPPGEGIKDYSIDIEVGSTNLYIATDGFFRQIKKDKNKEEFGRNGVLEIMNKVVKNEFSAQQKLFTEEFDKAKGDKPLSENISLIGLSF